MATVTLRPTGNGTLQTGTATGAATNWECVSEASSDDDVTYIVFGINGVFINTFTIGSSGIGTSDVINSVTVYIRMRNESSGRLVSSTNFPSVYEGGANRINSSAAGSTSYTNISNTWTTKPSSGLAWTKADIDVLEIGAHCAANSTNIRLTNVYVVVDYTPAGGGSPAAVKPIMMMLETDD